MAERISTNRYDAIIERIFYERYIDSKSELLFDRQELIDVSQELGIALPKNIGDLIYSFRFRASLPKRIIDTAPPGFSWIIRLVGRAKYAFALVKDQPISPNTHLIETKILDSTPGMISKYSLSDEQALLAKLRYNRILDIFLGITCYSLQNHLRAAVRGIGQVETDEIYVGVDQRGAHYVVPVQAKRGNDKIGIVQAEQDIALCKEKFPILICRPVSAQFMRDDAIALFELSLTDSGILIRQERHYKLVPPDQLSEGEISQYGTIADSA